MTYDNDDATDLKPQLVAITIQTDTLQDIRLLVKCMKN